MVEKIPESPENLRHTLGRMASAENDVLCFLVFHCAQLFEEDLGPPGARIMMNPIGANILY
jgi:hypothetical protein